jgi:hypothetical protein
MLSKLSVTVGLRNYHVIPDIRVERINCDCARAEIVCPPDTTLRELDDVISSVAEYETPTMRRLPLVRAS